MDIITEENRLQFIGEIIDGFEDFLEAKGVTISNPEKLEAAQQGEDPRWIAEIYGSDFDILEDMITNTLREWKLWDPHCLSSGQKCTSKDTSINSSKLPSIYNHINYHQLIWDAYDRAHKGIECLRSPIILDYGAGKHTEHIRKFLDSWCINYKAYDPYNGSDEDWNLVKPDLIVCSNVLNVIDSDEAMKAVHDYVSSQKVPYLITVYEGKKTGIGAISKKDCYQRNAKVATYKYDNEIVYKSVITKPEYKAYIK